MNFRYYIFSGDSWVECRYDVYLKWNGKKYRSAFNELDDLNSGKIKAEKNMWAIKITENGAQRLLLSPFGKQVKLMTFDTFEEAEANLMCCEKAAEEDELNMSFEIVPVIE